MVVRRGKEGRGCNGEESGVFKEREEVTVLMATVNAVQSEE